jgi:hypothetical protein
LYVSIEDLLGIEADEHKKRGPTPLVQKKVEQIEQLPVSLRKFLLDTIDNYLKANLQRRVRTMYSTYKLNADELSSDFIKALKNTYQHRQIEIIVQDVEDETEYLLSSPKNKKRLLSAVENVNNHKNLVEVELGSL